MKIYLAAKYGSRIEMRRIAAYLTDEGHTITSKWIHQDFPDDESVTEEILAHCAVTDVKELLEADTVVTFAHKRGELHPGGGRHVEFGIALQAGKRIIVVGPKGEHVFHYWPGVEHVENEEALAALMEQDDEVKTG